MIGLAGTNALPTMAPWGGIEDRWNQSSFDCLSGRQEWRIRT
jgi:hypothetical protein